MPTEPRKIVVDGVEYWVNGCTCVWDGDWREACDNHDVRYGQGGLFCRRLRADLLLWWDIWAIGRRKGWLGFVTHFFIGAIYFVGVRLFGWAFWSWRWKAKK